MDPDVGTGRLDVKLTTGQVPRCDSDAADAAPPPAQGQPGPVTVASGCGTPFLTIYKPTGLITRTNPHLHGLLTSDSHRLGHSST